MCGIVGFHGKRPAKDILLNGLSRLEYRGYESAGLVVFNDSEVHCEKEGIGRKSLANLRKRLNDVALPGTIGIAHTRWPTHGGISYENAHPHCCCQQNIWLVHNGTLENFVKLRQKIQSNGHKLTSETDSELIAHLIEEELVKNDFETAVQKTVQKLEGAFALAILCLQEPGKLIAVCRSGTMLIGKITAKQSEENEYMVASDYLALLDHTREIYPLHDQEMAIITDNNCEYKSFDGNTLIKNQLFLDVELDMADLRRFGHFMLKEIHEQPESITNTFRGRIIPDLGFVKLGGLEKDQKLINRLSSVDRVIIVACGTAYYAGLIGAQYLSSVGLMAEAHLASEFRYKPVVYNPKRTMILAISQSGETKDTIEAIKAAKDRGALTIAIVNRVGSELTRLDHSGIYCRAGFEVAVASTKAFTSQLTVLFMLLLYFGRNRYGMKATLARYLIRELQSIPEKISLLLSMEDEIYNLAGDLAGYENFLFIGRGYSYPVALEGALKLKEVSYIHAEGCAAGEMKHGTIALLDDRMPVIIVAPKDSVFEKTASNLQEVKARKSPIVLITSEDCDEFDGQLEYIIKVPITIEPLSPLLTVVPLQLFAYSMAVQNNFDPDKPRNLAKSVTVE